MKLFISLILLLTFQIATAQMPPKYAYHEQDILSMQERIQHPTIPDITIFTPRAIAAANRFFYSYNFVGMKFVTLAEMLGFENLKDIERRENEGLYYTIPSLAGTSGTQYFGFIVKGGIITATDFGVTP